MSLGEVSSATNSSNFPSISPHTPMAMNAMVIVVKGHNMHWSKLLVVSLQISHQFSPCTLMIVNIMVIVAKHRNMGWP